MNTALQLVEYTMFVIVAVGFTYLVLSGFDNLNDQND